MASALHYRKKSVSRLALLLTYSAPEEEQEKLIAEKLRFDNLCFQISRCPEILEVIFRNSNFHRLKKYRLVCKGWDQEICKTAKDSWLASLQEEDITELETKFKGRRGALLRLPPWIKAIKVEASHLFPIIVKTLLWTLNQGQIITKLDLKFSHNYLVPDRGFQLLLTTFSPFLTHFKTNYYSGSGEVSLPLAHYPALVALYISVSLSPFSYAGSFFLKMIAEAPRLRTLHVADDAIASVILEGADLSSIKRLGIPATSEGPEMWVQLMEAELPAVEELTINSFDERVLKALSRFGSSLKILKTSASSPALPYLPNLTTLELDTYKPGEMDLSSLPCLQNLIFNYYSTRSGSNATPGGNEIIAVSSSFPSVQSLTFRGHSIRLHGAWTMQYLPPDSSDFLELFKRFPNACNWEMDYCHTVSFCQAVDSSSSGHLIQVKSLNLVAVSRRIEPNEKLASDDRRVFSYVERLRDLEELGLFHYSIKAWGYIRVEQSSLQKMQKLKILKIRSEYPGMAQNYRFLSGLGLKVILYSPWKFNGGEDILSFENFEFRSCSKDDGMLINDQ